MQKLVYWYSIILVKCVNNNNKTERNTGLLCNIVITLLWIMPAFYNPKLGRLAELLLV